ncbi:hypothetical protein NPIL_224021 [Nephila pilipes]|uniref:Uncharacterized protein n=1 Tax=Nephila pilipes TaxID=299642 RepID=A0A8X6PLW0_NEPPI|nr:hypothetical protein NPIL_224021 [Nephila pilipes]
MLGLLLLGSYEVISARVPIESVVFSVAIFVAEVHDTPHMFQNVRDSWMSSIYVLTNAIGSKKVHLGVDPTFLLTRVALTTGLVPGTKGSPLNPCLLADGTAVVDGQCIREILHCVNRM